MLEAGKFRNRLTFWPISADPNWPPEERLPDRYDLKGPRQSKIGPFVQMRVSPWCLSLARGNRQGDSVGGLHDKEL